MRRHETRNHLDTYSNGRMSIDDRCDVEQALAQLPPLDSTLLLLFSQGCTARMVAEHLQLPTAVAARVRRYRALNKLGELL